MFSKLTLPSASTRVIFNPHATSSVNAFNPTGITHVPLLSHRQSKFTYKSQLTLTSSQQLSTLNNKYNNKPHHLQQNQQQLPTIDVMMLFDRMDSNQDGMISREEFQRALNHVDQIRSLQHPVSQNSDNSSSSKINSSNENTSKSNNQKTSSSSSAVSNLSNRVMSTFEVMVSKIFPAGFGWQAGSTIATQFNYTPEQLQLFLCTGVGDALGVMLGHLAYCALKKSLLPNDTSISMKNEVHTALLLGSAAFCSGTVWQPTVNFLHNTAHLSFNETLVGTGTVCTLAFFIGLRMGRMLYSRVFSDIEASNYANLKADIGLSVAIGGAGACFVGTDVSFADNWLRPLVGVEATAHPLSGCVLAGSSTAMGFVALQMTQNITVPSGKAWLD